MKSPESGVPADTGMTPRCPPVEREVGLEDTGKRERSERQSGIISWCLHVGRCREKEAETQPTQRMELAQLTGPSPRAETSYHMLYKHIR